VMVLTKVKSIAKEKGLAVLMTLHDPNLALLFSDQVLLLNGGKVVAKGGPEEVITEENIRRVYGLDVAFISQDGMEMICPKV
ncbi:MAG: ABC transporter ATP-binding protein, partial [Deltaproteobacteria bacterium]